MLKARRPNKPRILQPSFIICRSIFSSGLHTFSLTRMVLGKYYYRQAFMPQIFFIK